MNRYVSQLGNKQQMCNMAAAKQKFFGLKRPHTNIVPGPNIGPSSHKS